MDGDALNLTREACYNLHDYRIEMASLESPKGGPLGSFTGTRVKIDSDIVWWAPSLGNRPVGIHAFRGVLLHEIDHSFGLGHGGDQKWNLEGSTDPDDIPSMSGTATYDDTERQMTVEKEDVAGVMWAEFSAIDWWTANPGFEDGLEHWITSGGATKVDITENESWKGSRSVELKGSGEWVRIQQPYDPWNSPSHAVYDGMTSSPDMTIRTHYLDSGNKTGGVKIKYSEKYFDYDTAADKYHPESTGTWSSAVTLKICNQSEHPSWKACTYAISNVVYHDGTGSGEDVTNALAVKVTFIAQTTGSLFVDYAGVVGEFGS